MEAIYNIMDTLFERYDVLATVVAVFFIIYSIYNRIKYLCLEKAAEMVAKVEGNKDLSGEEKFSLCIIWIGEALPKIFKNSIFKTLLEKIVQYAYDNSFQYATNYIDRKLGVDINTAANIIKAEEENKSTETEESES